VGFIISLRFKLNLHTHRILREETLKMRLADSIVPEQTTPQARATVEALTGMPYENLWGNNNIGFLNRNRTPASALKTTQHGMAPLTNPVKR
jgi:oligogalacturonide transporter